MLYLLKEEDYKRINEKIENDLDCVSKSDLLKCAIRCYFKDDINVTEFYTFILEFINNRFVCYSIPYLKYYPSEWLAYNSDCFKKWIDKRYELLAVLRNDCHNLYVVYLV